MDSSEDFDEDIARWQHVLSQNPDNMQARLYLAGNLFAAGKWSQAVTEYRDILLRVPGDVGSRMNLARAYIALGSFSEAMKELDAIKASTGLDELRAEALCHLQQYDRAIAVLRPSVERDPSNVELQLMLSFCYVKLEQFSPAMETLQPLVESQSILPLFETAVIAIQRQMFDRAESILLELLEMKEDVTDESAEVLYYLGWIAFQRDQYPEARNFVHRSLQSESLLFSPRMRFSSSTIQHVGCEGWLLLGKICFVEGHFLAAFDAWSQGLSRHRSACSTTHHCLHLHMRWHYASLYEGKEIDGNFDYPWKFHVHPPVQRSEVLRLWRLCPWECEIPLMLGLHLQQMQSASSSSSSWDSVADGLYENARLLCGQRPLSALLTNILGVRALGRAAWSEATSHFHSVIASTTADVSTSSHIQALLPPSTLSAQGVDAQHLADAHVGLAVAAFRQQQNYEEQIQEIWSNLQKVAVMPDLIHPPQKLLTAFLHLQQQHWDLAQQELLGFQPQTPKQEIAALYLCGLACEGATSEGGEVDASTSQWGEAAELSTEDCFRLATQLAYRWDHAPMIVASSMQCAQGHLAAGDYKEALGALRLCATHVPDRADILCLTGYVALRVGEIEDASKWAKQAHALDPHDLYHCLLLAELALRRKRAQDGLGFLEEASALALPEYPLIAFFRGKCHHLLGDLPESRRHFEVAFQGVDHLNSALQCELLYGMGIVAEESGDMVEAMLKFEEVLSLNAGHALARFHLMKLNPEMWGDLSGSKSEILFASAGVDQQNAKLKVMSKKLKNTRKTLESMTMQKAQSWGVSPVTKTVIPKGMRYSGLHYDSGKMGRDWEKKGKFVARVRMK
jgi:tetratricopeptide (TPR) repeat protein